MKMSHCAAGHGHPYMPYTLLMIHYMFACILQHFNLFKISCRATLLRITTINTHTLTIIHYPQTTLHFIFYSCNIYFFIRIIKQSRCKPKTEEQIKKCRRMKLSVKNEVLCFVCTLELLKKKNDLV